MPETRSEIDNNNKDQDDIPNQNNLINKSRSSQKFRQNLRVVSFIRDLFSNKFHPQNEIRRESLLEKRNTGSDVIHYLRINMFSAQDLRKQKFSLSPEGYKDYKLKSIDF